jgi:hypothetical protein
MSTLGETNNAQFFPYLKVVRFISSRTAAYVDLCDTARIPWFTFNFRRYLHRTVALLLVPLKRKLKRCSRAVIRRGP